MPGLTAMRTDIDSHLQMPPDFSDDSGEDYYSSPAMSVHDNIERTTSETASVEPYDNDENAQGSSAGERHPLEAHLLALELEETERPPVYNSSSLAPDLIFSADSLKQDARDLAQVLVSFIAHACRSFGTTGHCEIASFSRFEKWQGRPQVAERLPATMLNEKNLIYKKALRYAKEDLTERGLWLRRFQLREERKKGRTIAEWVIEFSGAYKAQRSHVDIFEHHRELYSRSSPAQTPGHSRSTSLAAQRQIQSPSNASGWYSDDIATTPDHICEPIVMPHVPALPTTVVPAMPLTPPPPPPPVRAATYTHVPGTPHPQYPHHTTVGSSTPTTRGSDQADCIIM